MFGEANLPKVSVIIPAFNAGKFIEETLASVFAQTYKDFEVIVVNDGSTDNTEAALQPYRHQINYVKQKNRGLPASRERGLRASSGSLIAFLDADDIWLPTKLEKQVSFAAAHPEYGIITTDQLYFRDSKVVCGSYKDKFEVVNGFILDKILFGHWISPSAALIRRPCFEKVTTFDLPPPCFGEDWLMWMEIAAHYPVYFIDEVLVRKRLHRNNMTTYSAREDQFRCLLRGLGIVQQRIPQLAARAQLVREATFRVCFNRAVQDVYAVDLPHAREKLRLAITNKPFALNAWGLLAIVYMPEGLMRALKRGMKSLTKLTGLLRRFFRHNIPPSGEAGGEGH